jgi:hypothetical protein
VLLLRTSVFSGFARLARAEVHLNRRASERANRQCSCGSGETVPQFTFSLFKGFVNPISSVSTGFFLFFPVFLGLRLKKQRISRISYMWAHISAG